MATAKKGMSSSSSSAKQSGGGDKSAGGAKSKGGKSSSATSPPSSSSSKSRKARGGGGGRSSGKRELIDTGTDKRFVRRDGQGQFKESDDVGRSLAADRRKNAKTVVKSGQGDGGDRAK